MIMTCFSHIEQGIEDFTDEFEDFPLLEKKIGKKCDYCNENAEYIIKQKNS